jgi:hypothetical protein
MVINVAKQAFGLRRTSPTAPVGSAPERRPVPAPRQTPRAHGATSSVKKSESRQVDKKQRRPEGPSLESLSKEAWLQLRSLNLADKLPEDNYDISDPESVADEEEKLRRREKKAVPKWCDNYLESLNAQATLDPDSIFGSKVPLCALEDIFLDTHYEKANKSRPKRGRGSSADWRKDQLTQREISAYKRKLGQCKVWAAEPSAANLT